MKRYLLSTLMMIVCTICAAQSQTTFTIDGVEYTQSTVSTVNITGFTGSAESLTLSSPVTYNGKSYEVGMIGSNALSDADIKNLTISNLSSTAYAFDGNTYLESVTIGDGVSLLSMYTFRNCTNLKTLKISGSDLLTLSTGVFMGCTSLTGDIQLLTVETIYSSAFSGCTSPFTITVGENLNEIGDSSFNNSGLTSLIIVGNNNISTIGTSAFASCKSFTGNLNFPKLASIGQSAFSKAGSFSISVGPELKNIPNSTFDSSGITSFNVVGDNNISTIGSRAFAECTSLTGNLSFPNIVSIGANAFRSSSKVSGISVGNKLTTINTTAFYGTGITSFIIPESVTSLGPWVFGSCKQLKNVTFPENGKFTSLGNYLFYVSGITELIIPDYIESLGNNVYYGCSSLKTIQFPENEKFTTIPADGNSCYNIETVIIPENVTTVADQAFMNNKIASIDLPQNGIITWGTSVFQNNLITEIEIPETYKTVSTSMFAYNPIETITLHDGLESIQASAFASNSSKKTSFSTLTIPGTVTSIGESAFIGCQGLKTLIFELNEDDPYIDYTYGANAFGNYTGATVNIDEVQCWTPKAPTVATNTFSTQTYNNAKLIVSKDNRYSYEETPGWLLEPANGFLQFNTDRVLTGVEENIDSAEDEELQVYDATGILRMRTSNPEDMNSLPRGLYIVNGKKIIL